MSGREKDLTQVGSSSPAGSSPATTGGATLLERLLRLLRDGGMRSTSDLAREMETSPALVEAMLEDLARRGYLRTLEGHCTEHCQACPLQAACTVAGAGRVWSFTGEALEARER